MAQQINRHKYAGKRLFALLDHNPCRAGSITARSFGIVLANPGITYEAYIAAGGEPGDVRAEVICKRIKAVEAGEEAAAPSPPAGCGPRTETQHRRRVPGGVYLQVQKQEVRVKRRTTINGRPSAWQGEGSEKIRKSNNIDDYARPEEKRKADSHAFDPAAPGIPHRVTLGHRQTLLGHIVERGFDHYLAYLPDGQLLDRFGTLDTAKQWLLRAHLEAAK